MEVKYLPSGRQELLWLAESGPLPALQRERTSTCNSGERG